MAIERVLVNQSPLKRQELEKIEDEDADDDR